MAVEIGSMIDREPGVVGGRPKIAGTRMPVSRIAVISQARGLTAEQIVTQVFPHLTLAQVRAALAYYASHRAEIDTELAAEEAFVEEFQKQSKTPG
jgi:uncharacterized protein (DUF433 family)